VLALAGTAATPTIQLDGSSFRVTNWTAPRTPPAKGWPSIFAVYAGQGNVPPVLGSYSVDAGTLTFRPKFPIESGVKYRAVFRPGDGPAIEKTLEGPARDTTRRTRVDRVYPSADVWPSNQLRMYIYFSAPMSRGEADRRIRLVDDRGKELKGVFLPGEELWDPNCRRLTMTFDPGRIKRGLTSNEAMGPPLTEGRRYRLVIDGGWPDARGVPMVEAFSKVFRGGPGERVPPDPKQWRITAPKGGTNIPLIVDFPKPMNYALLQRMLQVSSGRNVIAGTVDVDRQESRWRFTPREPWKAGEYQLVVDTAIEDLAGNHIGEAFDIDVFDRVTRKIDKKTISLPFTPR
jgi:hypothetical protein